MVLPVAAKAGPRKDKMKKIRQFLFEVIKTVLRFFKRRPVVIDLSAKLKGARLLIANHSAANGPFTLELYFPYKFRPWGAHEMCGPYMERWHYLYDVFYRQKLRFSKLKAFLIATPFAVISRFLYREAGLIPTYQDMRMKTAFTESLKAMSEDEENILIFPENSSDGYHDVLKEYHPGFVKLAKLFYKRVGRDVPICAVYYSGRQNRMVIDEPVYLHKLFADGALQTDRQVAEYFKNRTNRLAKEYSLN